MFTGYIIKKDIYLDVSFKNFRYDRGIIRRILNVTLPTTIENLTSSFLVILINILLINTADITTIGVYIASARIVQLANILFQGLVMLF